MAHCLDVSRERCSASDRYLLDTNIIVGLVGRTTKERTTMYAPYSQFVERASRAGAKLFVSMLTLVELAGVVEKTQFARELDRAHATIDELKAFRENAHARLRVVAEISRMWYETASFVDVLDAAIPGSVASDFIGSLGTSRLDGINVALVAEAKRAAISTIVTHDRDFASASGIIVFTANSRALQ